MRRARFGVSALVAAVAILALWGGAAPAAELAVTIVGAHEVGKVYGMVFADAAGFNKRQNPVWSFIGPPLGGKCELVLRNLAPGKYGVIVFQDLNGNGDLDTNLLGVPIEPYGFSNDAAGVMGPPDFQATAVDLGTGDRAITIHLR
jgi:uncharacterized protein (DUF2141 family)